MQCAKQIFASVVGYIQGVTLAPSVLVVGFLGGELDAVPLVCANVLGCAHEGLGGSNNVGCILVQFFLVIRTRLVVCVCGIDGFNQGICFGIACPVTYVVANNQHFRVTLVLGYGVTHFGGVVQNGNECLVCSGQTVQVINGEVFVCCVGCLFEFSLHVGANFAHGLNLSCADGLEQLESTHVEESAGSVVWTLACLANQTDVLVGGVQSEAVGGNFNYTVGPRSGQRICNQFPTFGSNSTQCHGVLGSGYFAYVVKVYIVLLCRFVVRTVDAYHGGVVVAASSSTALNPCIHFAFNRFVETDVQEVYSANIHNSILGVPVCVGVAVQQVVDVTVCGVSQWTAELVVTGDEAFLVEILGNSHCGLRLGQQFLVLENQHVVVLDGSVCVNQRLCLFVAHGFQPPF